MKKCGNPASVILGLMRRLEGPFKCKIRKKKIRKMCCKNPGNSSEIHTKLELSIFLEYLCPQKPFLPQIVVLEVINFDLEASWSSSGKMGMKKCGNPASVILALVRRLEGPFEINLSIHEIRLVVKEAKMRENS